eukprot:TRINITY_DN5337_c0_g1_i1.p2 TRINITY_DN5337_c0_g1~~TRINITY_DN5337_c0_g1_i1.p2  ORF type:complete len:412 (+),score=19.00 TRINITY_DN5337_c0_g1_i1:441-1676(+)
MKFPINPPKHETLTQILYPEAAPSPFKNAAAQLISKQIGATIHTYENVNIMNPSMGRFKFMITKGVNPKKKEANKQNEESVTRFASMYVPIQAMAITATIPSNAGTEFKVEITVSLSLAVCSKVAWIISGPQHNIPYDTIDLINEAIERYQILQSFIPATNQLPLSCTNFGSYQSTCRYFDKSSFSSGLRKQAVSGSFGVKKQMNIERIIVKHPSVIKSHYHPSNPKTPFKANSPPARGPPKMPADIDPEKTIAVANAKSYGLQNQYNRYIIPGNVPPSIIPKVTLNKQKMRALFMRLKAAPFKPHSEARIASQIFGPTLMSTQLLNSQEIEYPTQNKPEPVPWTCFVYQCLCSSSKAAQDRLERSKQQNRASRQHKGSKQQFILRISYRYSGYIYICEICYREKRVVLLS